MGIKKTIYIIQYANQNCDCWHDFSESTPIRSVAIKRVEKAKAQSGPWRYRILKRVITETIIMGDGP